MRHALLLLITFAAAALSGCAGFSHDGGFDPVAAAARQHLAKDVEWPRTAQEQAKLDTRVAQLLERPLTVDDAVQVALLNNRMLQSAFEELGISEADLVQAGRLPNPRFDLRHATGAGQYDIEETLSFNVLALLTMPSARAIEKRRFAQTQDAAVLTVAQLAKDTREAYYAAVAARESRMYLQQVRAAAETGAKLAQRMMAAGNWNRLDQAREQSFYIDAVQGSLQAQLAAESASERLLSLMGVPAQKTAAAAVQLETSLPPLPQELQSFPDVEHAVLQDRLDLRLMRAHLDELQQRLKLTRGTRFINVLDAGATRVQQGGSGAPYQRGYTVTLEVPIFDSGAARVKKAEAVYAQAVDRFTQAAVEARSQLRLAYAAYRTAYDLARQQRDEVLPLRQTIARENLLRYNASQISVFELLSDAREQAAGTEGYIQRVRDFWIAKSQLDAAALGNPISSP
jgi:outer membrane protein TolC